MAEKRDDGGPAFPRPMSGQLGMSLRDYFAGQALRGLVHDILIEQHWEDVLLKQGLKVEEFPAYCAHLCYVQADAMIAERSK